jgi:hypothetical protein
VSRGSLEIVSSRGIDMAIRQVLTWQAGGINVASRGDVDTARGKRTKVNC